MKLFLCLIILFSFLFSPSLGWTWVQGTRTQIYVNMASPVQYEVAVNGIVWLQNAPFEVYIDGKWYTETSGLTFKTSQIDIGQDNLGTFNYAMMSYVASDSASTPINLIFRYYPESDLFSFNTVFPNGANNTAVQIPAKNTFQKNVKNVKIFGESEFNSTSLVSTKFPSFISTSSSMLGSKLGYYEWHGRFADDSSTVGFGLSEYQGGTEGGPLLLFDPSFVLDRTNADALLIAPSSHFKDSTGSLQNNTLCFGVQGYASSIPSGYSTSFSLSFSQYGANAVVDVWGAALRKMYPVPKIDPQFDPVNNKLSYWTDNGAFYYAGYWGSYPKVTAEEVLLNLSKYISDTKVPVGSIQLDPWWYITSGTAGACANFTANPTLFPNGIEHVKDQVPIPFVIYSSYFTPNNVYVDKFPFLVSHYFDVSWAKGQIAVVAPNSSYQFYSYIMDSTSSVLGGFEIDFMDFQYLLFDGMVTEIDSWRTFLSGSDRAALDHNVSIQYCMELPLDILQSVEFASVTSARASEDDFPTNNVRWSIGFTSMLHRAVGLGPFFDNFWSTSQQPGNPYNNATEPNAELASIISTLSAGPVGIGDGIGYFNSTRIMQSVNANGVILKPTLPMVPIDPQLVPPNLGGVPQGSTIWSTYAQVGSYVNYYVLAISLTSAYALQLDYLWPRPTEDVYWVADYTRTFLNQQPAENSGLVQVTAIDPFNIPVQTPSSEPMPFGYYSIAPVLSNGWAIIGETSKLVTLSPNRVTDITITSNNGLEVTLTGAPQESISFVFVNPSGTVVIEGATISSNGTATITVQ